MLDKIVERIETDFFSADLRPVSEVCRQLFAERGRSGAPGTTTKLGTPSPGGAPSLYDEVDGRPRPLSLQEVVNFHLPLEHRLKLLGADALFRDRGLVSEGGVVVKKALGDLKKEVVKGWKTMDPVDMETWEKERFEQGEQKVKRMR